MAGIFPVCHCIIPEMSTLFCSEVCILVLETLLLNGSLRFLWPSETNLYRLLLFHKQGRVKKPFVLFNSKKSNNLLENWKTIRKIKILLFWWNNAQIWWQRFGYHWSTINLSTEITQCNRIIISMVDFILFFGGFCKLASIYPYCTILSCIVLLRFLWMKFI